MTKSTYRRIGLVTILLVMLGCSRSADIEPHVKADRVFVNGTIYTVDENRSWAHAVAISDGEIIYVGDNDGAEVWIGDATEIVDLSGQMMLPGFHDSHTHLLIGVLTEDDCDLLRVEPLEAVHKRLEECTEISGYGEDHWIDGVGWSEWLWEDANPNKAKLDALFPDRPVFLESSFGHAAWVNSKALEIASIDASTADPIAGRIERDPISGEPSGTLRETAMSLVKDLMPEKTLQQRIKGVNAAIDMAHSLGVTAVIEPGADAYVLEPILAVDDSVGLDLRALVSLSPISWQPGVFGDEVYEMIEQREQWQRPNISVDSVKIYMDGVIEYGTSPLLEPYSSGGYGKGEFFYTQEKVDEYMIQIDAAGLQVHVHAIGDAAIRRALDGFQAMRQANGFSGNRHHIVHLQLIDEADIPRFAKLDIGATFQSLWAYPDPAAIEMDVPLLGKERAWRMYPIASVHRSGGRIVGGSDYWVTDMNPLLAIETAITRQNPWTNEGLVLGEDERVDLETMIAAYTINGAYTMKLEAEQGSIEVGKRADFVVLDRNLFDIPPSEISDAKITMTIFDGRTVYE